MKISEIHPDVEVPLFVVMPNHIHMVILLDGGVGLPYPVGLPHCDCPTNSPTDGNSTSAGKDPEMQRRAYCCGRLSHIIGQFKSAVTKFANANQIPFSWQPRYHDRIVRNRNEMNRIALYIEQNPMKWETDCFYDCE